MIHQRELSFKQLRSMKILDRNSCYVSMSHTDTDRTAECSNTAFFSQFGGVKSLRSLHGNGPKEIYVRFADQPSAARAIAWFDVRPSRCIGAKHGFSRYCFKFLNGKECRNASCENRHAWANMEEVLSFGDNAWNVPNAHAATKETSTEICSLQQQTALQGCIIDDLLREIAKLRNYNVVLESGIVKLKQGLGFPSF